MKLLLQREWLLAVRALPELCQPLIFALMLLVIFPIAVGAHHELLPQIAAGVIWVAVLLAVLLAGDKSLKHDYYDGSLAQLALSKHSLLAVAASKIVVQWLVLIAPMIMALPLLALWYQLPMSQIGVLALTVLLGSPTVLLLAMLGAALTLSMARGGLLLVLVVLPFYFPVLIFAVAAVSAEAQGFSVWGQLALLAALALLAMTALPFAIAAALRVALADAP